MNRDRLKKYKPYNYFPKDRKELYDLICQLIKERGQKADLNDIDVSKVENMSYLFSKLSGLDQFNGDISRWDVSKVTRMIFMFKDSIFDRNIDEWTINPQCNMKNMFDGCPLESHPPKWYKK